MRNHRFSPASFRPVPSKASQGGFSLIEIIIVVVLIGGIVAFATSKIFGGRDRANVNLAKAQVQTLAEKIEQYQMDTGTLPGTLGDLIKAPADANGWLGPYAKEAEFSDPWKQAYTYKVPGESRPFDLVSLGADRKVGGDSVNADIQYQ